MKLLSKYLLASWLGTVVVLYGPIGLNLAATDENPSGENMVNAYAENLLEDADSAEIAAKVLEEKKFKVSHLRAQDEKAEVVLGTLSTHTVSDRLVMQWSICAVYANGHRQVFAKREHFYQETKDGKVTLRKLPNW